MDITDKRESPNLLDSVTIEEVNCHGLILLIFSIVPGGSMTVTKW